MKIILFCLLLFCSGALLAQGKPCSEYAKILQQLEATFQNGAGNLDDCLHLVDALRACDPAQEAKAVEWTHNIFDAIKKQKTEAETAKARAIVEEQKARAATRVAQIAQDTAEAAKARAVAEEKKARAATKIAKDALHRTDSLIEKVLDAQYIAKNITLESVQAIQLFEEKISAPTTFQQDVLLDSLKKELKAYADKITALQPFKDAYWGQWGYKDKNGDIVILARFDEAFAFEGNYAKVQIAGAYYKIDKTGNIISIYESNETPWKWEPSNTGKEIPKNAVPGGYSLNKVATFICRARFDRDIYAGIHPGTLERDSCHFGWGGKEIVRDSFEVLVLRKETEIKWVKAAEIDNYPDDSPWQPIAGGWNSNESGDALFIVHTLYKEELISGKYFTGNCNFPYHGKEELTKDFEYLLVRTKK